MNRSGISQSVEMQEVTTDTMRSLIETFFQRMTEVQWSLLKAGDPDDSTKFLLAELLLEMVQAVTNTILASLKDTREAISKKEVQTELGDILSESFCEALGIRNKVQCVNSDRLTTLVVQEVTKSIRSTLSSPGSAESEICQYVTPPTTLNKMITCASKMLKTLTAKMQKVFYPRVRWHRGSQTSPQQMNSNDLVLEDVDSEDDDDSCQSPASTESEALEEKPQQDPFVVKEAKTIEAIIQMAVSNITEPLLQDVLDSHTVSVLQAESNSDSSTLAMDIAKSIKDKVQSLGSNDTTESLKEEGHKIKTLIANCLTEVSLHRLVDQLKNKYHHESECERVDSAQSLATEIDLLEPEDEEQEHDGKELCIFPRYKTLTGNNVMVLTEDLTERVYCYIKYGTMKPEIVPAEITRKSAAAPQVDAAMYKDILQKIRCFVALIKWWQETQAASHSKKLTLAIQNTESVAQGSVEELTAEVDNICFLSHAVPASTCVETTFPTSEEVAEETERKMTHIMSLVKTLVTQLYDSVNMTMKTNKSEVITQRLFKKLWSKVKRAEFSVTPETLKSLDKAIFKDLMKKWGSAENVLILLNLEEPAIDKLIVTCLHTRLMAPAKKQSAIGRFFSSVGKAFSKASRRAA
ncbi:hypothetical protein PAMP_010871 [Pampus punctatissimus]